MSDAQHHWHLVADDHEIVRGGICAILQNHPGWQVCGEVADGRLAVAMCLELRPDIAILDIGMPNLNGLEAARQIASSIPHVKVLILSVSGSEHIVRKAIEAGAQGYLLKSDAGDELINAVEALQQNRLFWHVTVEGGFFHKSLNPFQDCYKKVLPEILTRREREIVQLIAEGKGTKEIAVALGLSVKTVETHRANLMQKLDLHSVAEVVLYAVKNDLVQVPCLAY